MPKITFMGPWASCCSFQMPVYLHCAWSPLGRWSAPIFTAMNDERLNVPKRLGVLEGYDGLELPYRALNEECLRW